MLTQNQLLNTLQYLGYKGTPGEYYYRYFHSKHHHTILCFLDDKDQLSYLDFATLSSVSISSILNTHIGHLSYSEFQTTVADIAKLSIVQPKLKYSLSHNQLIPKLFQITPSRFENQLSKIPFSGFSQWLQQPVLPLFGHDKLIRNFMILNSASSTQSFFNSNPGYLKLSKDPINQLITYPGEFNNKLSCLIVFGLNTHLLQTINIPDRLSIPLYPSIETLYSYAYILISTANLQIENESILLLQNKIHFRIFNDDPTQIITLLHQINQNFDRLNQYENPNHDKELSNYNKNFCLFSFKRSGTVFNVSYHLSFNNLIQLSKVFNELRLTNFIFE